MKSLILLAAFVGAVFSIPVVGEAGGRVVVRGAAVRVAVPRANVVVARPFVRQPVVVQQQFHHGFGGVQAFVAPGQCFGGNCNGAAIILR